MKLKTLRVLNNITPRVRSYGETMVIGASYNPTNDEDKVLLVVDLHFRFEYRTVKAVVDLPATEYGVAYYNLMVKNGHRFSDATITLIALIDGEKPAENSDVFVAL